MPNLAPIIYSADDPRNGGVAETISAAAAPSINAAFAQIHAESDIKPIVLHPYGGARTKAECIHEGLSWTISDHYEAAAGRAAVDIDNQEQLRHWNQARFLQIMADHGWHNMTTTGAPFPKEPWHFAKHGITTTGDGTSPLPDSKGLPEMELVRNTADATKAPKYHGDVVLFDTVRIIRKKGDGSYAVAQDRFGIQDTDTDVQFLGRLNGFGWLASEYDQVRALDASNAIGERLADGTLHAYVANDTI